VQLDRDPVLPQLLVQLDLRPARPGEQIGYICVLAVCLLSAVIAR
jgi:hypothetical protein